ncbi:anaphase-promoting complex subunit CDC26-like [Homalodisca vitripennis]|uniref:anaphase-promoting complex subunit CDC26-like n=1 Tax=Homalodisca vitripennis TaxID=197043 RepID=UPI001EE9E6DE|nr:anaphase-promoting complex subunit CDC26-like [Homalodisca vitripennis]
MIRRSPTRIELKLEDLTEYQPMRREYEANKEQRQVEQRNWGPNKPKQDIQQTIHDRIGYNPQPRPSS